MRELIVDTYLGDCTVALSPDIAIEEHVLARGVWEPSIVRCIDRFVTPGMVCADVGANSGLLTLAIAKRVGDTGHVYAFEPSTFSFQRLEQNLSSNPHLACRVQRHQEALGEKSGELKLFESGNKPGNAYVSDEYNPAFWNRGDETQFVRCRVETLDSFFTRKALDFIKIYVEGMELEVLKGAVKTITRQKPLVIFETLLRCFDHGKIQGCEALLRSWGYLIFLIHPKQPLLLPTSYPNLGEDSLAIHRDVVEQYRSAMFDERLLDQALRT